MKRILLVIGGSLSLAMGILGIFLPVLPTTPFLLLSSACYIRSSDRLYRWLINHKLFGSYIRYYMEYRAVTVRAKIISLSGLWIVISISAFLFMEQFWIRLILFFIATAVSVHILMMKTLTKEMLDKFEK